MSILIKGATLPNSCWDCEADFAYQIGCELWQDYEEFCERRHPNCPLVEIPTPHGRLIDGDKIETDMIYAVIDNLRNDAPTILEAEESR